LSHWTPSGDERLPRTSVVGDAYHFDGHGGSFFSFSFDGREAPPRLAEPMSPNMTTDEVGINQVRLISTRTPPKEHIDRVSPLDSAATVGLEL